MYYFAKMTIKHTKKPKQKLDQNKIYLRVTFFAVGVLGRDKLVW